MLLRTKVLTGEITLDEEQTLINDSMEWLEMKSDEFPVYGEYLQQCSVWENPWKTVESES